MDRRARPATFKRMLIATDGSRLSARAVDAGIRLAAATGARVTVFHATAEFPVTPFPEYAISSDAAAVDAWEKAQQRRARRILSAARARAERAGVPCVTRSAQVLQPHLAILEAAKHGKCDLIVMASHGRRGVKALILGSETQKLLARTPLPVLVCR
jgi:nucleotide-binding universal stress UspA family protein